MAADFRVYAYGDGGFDDFGWGCTYRNIMSVLAAAGVSPPEFRVIYEKCQAQSRNYERLENSKVDARWIEPHQAGCYLQENFGFASFEMLILPAVAAGDGSGFLSCTDVSVYSRPGNFILYSDSDSERVLQLLKDHCGVGGWVILDNGTYSYCFLAARGDGFKLEVLIGDPHRARPASSAGGPVAQLAAMGFSADVAAVALRLCSGNFELALDRLLTDMPACVAAVEREDSETRQSFTSSCEQQLLEDLQNLEPALPVWKLACDFLRFSQTCGWALLFIAPQT